MTTFQEVLIAARGLELEDRLLLVATIRDELEEADMTTPDPAVLAELERRTNDFFAGKTRAVSFEDALARARKVVGVHE